MSETKTQTPEVTYRRTKAGTWAVMGPADIVTAGATVTVVKRSGETKTERIASVGRAFTRDGVRTVYGYPEPTSRPAATTSTRSGGSRSRMCDECGERRAVTTAYDLSGILGDVCGRCKRDEGSLSFC
jgi:hypothetical protein